MNVGEDVIVLIILYVLFGCFDYYQLCDLFYQPHPDQSSSLLSHFICASLSLLFFYFLYSSFPAIVSFKLTFGFDLELADYLLDFKNVQHLCIVLFFVL